VWICIVPMANWGYFVEKQWPRILLEVMVVMAHHSRRFAMPGGLTLLMCRLRPHLQ
jgi:hypothetical protein